MQFVVPYYKVGSVLRRHSASCGRQCHFILQYAPSFSLNLDTAQTSFASSLSTITCLVSCVSAMSETGVGDQLSEPVILVILNTLGSIISYPVQMKCPPLPRSLLVCCLFYHYCFQLVHSYNWSPISDLAGCITSLCLCSLWYFLTSQSF